MIEPDGPLSLSRQSVLLGVSRSSLYYRPRGESVENLALMRRMDELHMDYPFYGSRQMMRHLRREGVAAGRLVGGDDETLFFLGGESVDETRVWRFRAQGQ